MERDLAAIRARRAERERAAGAAKMRQASPEPKEPPAELGGEPSPSKASLVAESNVEHEDIVMSDDAPNPDPGGSANVKVGDSSEPSVGQDMDSDPKGALTETKPSPAMNSIPPSTHDQATTIDTKLEFSLDGNGPSTAMHIATTAELHDPDFESMFKDVEGADADNEINLDDLDFSTDANMGQALINNNAFGDIASTNNGLIDLNAASNEDINTLLPGLENYVHDGGDFTMLDIPPATALPASAVLPQPPKAGNGNVADAVADAAPVESNFDNMFYGSGDFTMGGAEDGDMMDDEIGDFGDFNEAWFQDR